MSDAVATPSQNNPGCLDGPTLFVLLIGGGAGVWACFAQGGWWPGAGAALAFLALATVAALIANVLRRAIKPQAVFASGFLNLLWAHVFWGIGPQSFGVLIAWWIIESWLLK